MNTGLEQTTSSRSCRSCGRPHMRDGCDYCAECSERMIPDKVVGWLLGGVVAALVLMAVGCFQIFGSDISHERRVGEPTNPEQAISCAGSEVNGKSPQRVARTWTQSRRVDTEDQSPGSTKDIERRMLGVTAGETASISTVDRSAHRPPNAGRPAGENVRLDRMHQPVKSDRVFSVVNDTILDAIAWRESRNNPRAVGKRGELGAYQIRAIAVREINRVHGTRYRHSDAVAQGRELARYYLLITERELTRILRRNPTAEELYQGYRFGVTGFRNLRSRVRLGLNAHTPPRSPLARAVERISR